MATPVPPDMSGMLSDLQQRSDRPSGTRSCNDLATPTHQISRRHQIGARSHESERQTSRRGHGGSPQPRIASQAWTVYQDLRQDVDAVAKAKDFEDAPPRKRKRVAACCGVSGLTLAAALFSVLFFFFALQRTGLWSLGRRTADHDVLSIQDIKRGIIDWAMHWQVGLAMYDSWRAVAFAGHWPADNPSGPQRKLGLRVQLRDVASGKYVRMLTPGEASVGDYGGVVSALVADKEVPWLHGGTFEVIETDTGGWELVTRAEPSAGKWLETHGSGGGFWRPHWSARTAASPARDANASAWGGFWLHEWLGSAYDAPECAPLLAHVADGLPCGEHVARHQAQGLGRLAALAHVALLHPSVCGACGGFSVGNWSWDNRTAVLPPHNASTARTSASTAPSLALGEGATREAGSLSYPEDLEQRWVWSALVATVDGSDRHGDSEARGTSQEREPFAWIPETDAAANGSVRLRAPGWEPPLYVGVGDDHVLRLVPRSSASLFDVAPLTQLKGANLGSWLIPEKAFMSRDSPLNESLCELARTPEARATLEAEMQHHVETWVTEAHFDWMAAHGINMVRVPLGWWNVLDFSELPEVGVGPSWVAMPPAAEVSMRALDRVFAWSAARGMRVLLDLHGAPGSQNGMDHSGCLLQSGWWRDDPEADAEAESIWTRTYIFSLTSDDHYAARRDPAIGAWGALRAIRKLMARYGRHPALYGVELLNEPGDSVKRPFEDDMRAELIAYYHEAYAAVREHSDTVIVVFCVLYWFDYWAWVRELREPAHFNVALDMHLYAAFDGFTPTSPDDYLVAAADAMNCKLRAHAYHHPLLVGEWALSSGGRAPIQEFVDGQFQAFEHALGWFFWTLKTDHLNTPVGQPTWDLIWAVDGYAPDRPDRLQMGSDDSWGDNQLALRQSNFTDRWLELQPGAAPLEAYEQSARPGAYEPPDSIAWLKEWPGSEPIAELLRQAPPPVRRLPRPNARVPIAQLHVPRASDTPDMHRCERVGAWPLILLVGGTLVVLVTSYVVLRVLGFLSWRALGFAYHSVKMVVLIAFKRLKEAC